MGRYFQSKMEYYRGSAGAIRFYRIWLTVLTLYTVINVTWKITTSGYDTHIYFFLDILVGGFALIALLSFLPCDRSTVFGNLAFIGVFIGAKAYKTFHFLSVTPDAAAVSAPGMDAMGMGAGMASDMAAMGGMGGMGGMDMMGEAAAAIPVSPDMGLLGQLVQKLLRGPFKVQGDFSKFIIVTECELFAVLCVALIILFISQWSFYKTPLDQLRERG